MKATRLLERQHKKTLTALKKLEKGQDMEMALEVARELAAHMAIEHKAFYPAAIELKRPMIEESFEEHALAELAVKRMLACPEGDPSWRGRIVALRELVEHHAKEEEEELFPVVEKRFSEEELEQLGRTMQQEFEQAMAQEEEPSAAGRALVSTTADKARERLEKSGGSRSGARESGTHKRATASGRSGSGAKGSRSQRLTNGAAAHR